MNFRISIRSPTIISDNEFISSFELYFEEQQKRCRILNQENLEWDEQELRSIIKLIEGALYMDSKGNYRINPQKFWTLQDQYRRIATKHNVLYENVIDNLIQPQYSPKNKVTLPIHHKVTNEGIVLEPYIPGSSIKGALRKSLLKYYLSKKGITFQLTECISKHYRNANTCFDEIFGYNPEGVNGRETRYNPSTDVFRFLEVSDFMPENYRLSLREMRRVYRDDGRNAKGIPVHAIFIEEGNFNGTISIKIPERLRREVIRKFSELLQGNYDSEEKILLSLIGNLKGEDIKDGESGTSFYLGFGKGADKASIAGAHEEFKRMYVQSQRRKGRWPPSTLYVLNDNKRPGLVSIKVVE